MKTAKLNLQIDKLANLPIDAVYRAQDGNATATIEKKEDGLLVFTANCDSLSLVIKNLTKEVYRYKSENEALRNSEKIKDTQYIQEPSGWQWFQIWIGRIAIFIIGIYIIYRKFKK